MINQASTAPATSTDQVSSVLVERDLQALDAAFQFHLTDIHARVLSKAEPVEPATMKNLNVRGLAEPGSAAYQPD